MARERKITEDVWAFLGRATDLYGKAQADRFSQELYCELIERGIESPIEDLFYIACRMHYFAQYIDVDPEPRWDAKSAAWCPGIGIFIFPQHPVERYRVDFLVDRVGYKFQDGFPTVVVELDGHEFHDKDKRQRAYEKARDRVLVKKGYRVLHFTGSEVVSDPYRVAYEALDHLGIFDPDFTYDQSNPFGIE